MQFSSKNLQERQCLELNYAPVPAVKNYNKGYISPLGFRVFFSTNPRNVPLVIASGKVLENMRNCDMPDQKILAWAFEIGAKFSRLDLAVTETVTEHELEIFTMSDVRRWIANKAIISPLLLGGQKGIVDFAPKEEEETQEDTIETIYIGNQQERAKKGIFRAYDKGLEIGGLAANLISRIELEIKRERAQVTAKKLAETYDIAGNFRARFDVLDPVFERIMDAPAIELKRGKGVKNKEENEDLDNKWRWLLNQVAPALAKALQADKALGRGQDNLNRFIIASGLADEMKGAVRTIAQGKYADMLLKNGLVDISQELWHNHR